MPSLEEMLAALTGRRPVAQDDPVRGYTPPSDPLAAPPPYAPSPWEAAAMRQRNAVKPPAGRAEGALTNAAPTPAELVRNAQEFHAGDAAFREALPGKIAQGVLAMPHVMADLPRAVVNTSLVQPIRKGAELMARAAGGEDVTTNPQDVGEAFGAANVAMGGAAPFAPKGALGSAGGKLVIPAAERAAGTTSAPFYSAVDSALSNAKLEKAPLDQWHNYLKTQPNVKIEELNQLGLNPSSSGFGPNSLTKAQLQEHLDANRVQLKEVNKGNADSNPRLQQVNKEMGDLAELQNTPLNQLPPEYHNFDFRSRMDELRQERKQLVGDTKYSSYQLPGASNYGETLLTLPPKSTRETELAKLRGKYSDNFIEQATPEERAAYSAAAPTQYRSSHWDEPNVLVHVRHNDRAVPAPNGEGTVPSLHLEEVQSDWHQAGRKQGYEDGSPRPTKEDHNRAIQEYTGYGYELAQKYAQGTPPGSDWMKLLKPEERAKLDELATKQQKIGDRMYSAGKGVPDAPFKDTWPDLALKRMLHKAATETNVDGTPKYYALSWTPGEAQAARYDLSKQLKELQYLKHDDGTYEIAGVTKDGSGFNHPDKVPANKLSDIVGKEIAEKIIKNEGKRARGHPANGGYFEGVDLKVGGEGMKEFYDKMLVNKANALGKKFGARVGQHDVPVLQKNIVDPDSPFIVMNEGQVGPAFRDRASAQEYIDTNVLDGATIEKNNQTKKQPVHVLPITPELRQAAARGFPLFSMGLALPGAAPLDDRAAKALATKPPDVGQYR